MPNRAFWCLHVCFSSHGGGMGCSAFILSSVGSAVTNGSGPGAHAYLTNKGKCIFF